MWFPGLADLEVSRVGVEFAESLEPTVAGGFEIYRQDVVFGGYSTHTASDAIELARGLDENYAAVALNTRVKVDTPLEVQCQNLMEASQMGQICTGDEWLFGAQVGRSPKSRDARWFLVLGRAGAVTPTHVDPGVQAVFYHTVSGLNHVMGVPREVASRILAVRRCLEDRGCRAGLADSFEKRVLDRCLHRRLLEYAQIGPGETLLILPRGGHAVMTGDSKVVVAGEWHHRCG